MSPWFHTWFHICFTYRCMLHRQSFVYDTTPTALLTSSLGFISRSLWGHHAKQNEKNRAAQLIKIMEIAMWTGVDTVALQRCLGLCADCRCLFYTELNKCHHHIYSFFSVELKIVMQKRSIPRILIILHRKIRIYDY